MKRWLRVLWLAAALSAFAQAQDEPAAADPAAPDDPCAPLELPDAATGEDQPPAVDGQEPAAGENPGGLGRIGADGLPCPPLETAVKDAAPAGQEGAGEDATGGEAAGDFEPTEEISEDYPVPLPSDI